jgi:tetratricopeptide (TPR) repeat protein
MTVQSFFWTKRVSGCLFLISALCCAAGGQSAANMRTLKARVFMPNGSLSRNIKIRVENTVGEIIRDGFTDTEGYFEINNLALGTYQISVPTDSRAYETAVERLDISSRSPDLVTVTIHLNPISEATTAHRRQARSVSVKESDANIPRKALDAYRRGVALSKKGRLAEAVEELKNAIAAYPDYVRAYNDLGLAYMKLDRMTEASQALEKAVSIEPRAFNPRLNLAIAHVRRLDFAGAEPHLRAAAAIDPSSALVHLYLGIVLYQTKRIDPAEDELSRAVALESGEVAVAHYYLGEIYIKRGRTGSAIAEFEAYLREQPDATDAASVRKLIADLRAQQK